MHNYTTAPRPDQNFEAKSISFSTLRIDTRSSNLILNFKALTDFANFREIHIYTPRTNTTEFMVIRIGFAEENDSNKISILVVLDKLDTGITITARAL